MFAIHCPPMAGDREAAAQALRARRMGFSYAGFVFGPFWLLAHRLWLPAFIYVALAVVFAGLIGAGVFAAPSAMVLELLAAVFVGLEGRQWVGAALARRGLPLVDIIEAHDADEAARAYFNRALAEPVPAPARADVRAPPPARDREIIGLFPEARR